MEKENLELAVAISDYLHSLDGLQPLVWHQARGISKRLAEVVLAHLGSGCNRPLTSAESEDDLKGRGS